MPSLTDGAIRQVLKRVELIGKHENLVDGEGRGMERLVLALKPNRGRYAVPYDQGDRRRRHPPQSLMMEPAYLPPCET